MGSEQDASIPASPGVKARTFPTDLCEPDVERWLTWKATDDGRKIPRAPYEHPGQPDRYVSAQDPAVWTDFESARDWALKLPGHRLAVTIRDRDEYPDEDLVLLDYDDARDPDSGAVHPTVREHLAAAGSYADVSPSGTGVHVLCRGALPDGTKTISDRLPADEAFPEASIEVYDSARYVAMSGHHIEATPADTRPAQSFLDAVADEYATVVDGTPDALLDDPRTPASALADMATTSDMQHVFDAIAQTTPVDVRLRSPVTEERSDGTTSRDPAWTRSESGTRLAELDDGWIYRDGMVGLDALQVVALEEGIIADERTYPQGQDFWDAVEALRDRGAHIPEYESPDRASDVATGGGAGGDVRTDAAGRGATDATSAASGDDPGDAAEVDRALEVSLLRERVADQAARIETLEAELAEREATIEALEAELASHSDDDDHGDSDDGDHGDGDSDDTTHRPPDSETDSDSRSGRWRRLQHWLRER